MGCVLLVDDDQSFLSSLVDGLRSFDENIIIYTASDGLAAVSILENKDVDLVVTDLKMPAMDGFELLVFIHNNFSTIPVIVMTAYGKADVEHYFEETGGIQYLEKPLDFLELTVRITESIVLKTRGFVHGVKLTQIMQLLEVVNKTCTLSVFSGNNLGHLYFTRGKLLDAKFGDHSGAEAAIIMASWVEVQIVLNNICPKLEKKVSRSIRQIVMQARIRKVFAEGKPVNSLIDGKIARHLKPGMRDEIKDIEKILIEPDGKFSVSTKDKLQAFTAIEGFCGVGLFSCAGKPLGVVDGKSRMQNLKNIGDQISLILSNAQNTSLKIGVGRGELVHIETEEAMHVLIRCLNESSNPLETEPGKAHIHLFLLLSSDSGIGLAKMKVNTLIRTLAKDFR